MEFKPILRDMVIPIFLQKADSRIEEIYLFLEGLLPKLCDPSVTVGQERLEFPELD